MYRDFAREVGYVIYHLFKCCQKFIVYVFITLTVLACVFVDLLLSTQLTLPASTLKDTYSSYASRVIVALNLHARGQVNEFTQSVAMKQSGTFKMSP